MLSETLGITKRALEHAEEDRNRLDEEATRLRVSFPSTSLAVGADHHQNGRHTASATALHFWEDQAHQLQLRLDAAQREHGAEVNRLESQLSEATRVSCHALQAFNATERTRAIADAAGQRLLRNELADCRPNFFRLFPCGVAAKAIWHDGKILFGPR